MEGVGAVGKNVDGDRRAKIERGYNVRECRLGGRGWSCATRGKSGLHRARWWLTATEGNLRESAAESKPPKRFGAGKGERVR